MHCLWTYCFSSPLRSSPCVSGWEHLSFFLLVGVEYGSVYGGCADGGKVKASIDVRPDEGDLDLSKEKKGDNKSSGARLAGMGIRLFRGYETKRNVVRPLKDGILGS